jgi:hypothetical protein
MDTFLVHFAGLNVRQPIHGKIFFEKAHYFKLRLQIYHSIKINNVQSIKATTKVSRRQLKTDLLNYFFLLTNMLQSRSL